MTDLVYFDCFFKHVDDRTVYDIDYLHQDFPYRKECLNLAYNIGVGRITKDEYLGEKKRLFEKIKNCGLITSK
jgi:hypothetical protein